MKKVVFILFAFILTGTMVSRAQDTIKPVGYKFTDIKRLPATSIKDQYRSGTCWSWSPSSFLESEMMRLILQKNIQWQDVRQKEKCIELYLTQQM